MSSSHLYVHKLPLRAKVISLSLLSLPLYLVRSLQISSILHPPNHGVVTTRDILDPSQAHGLVEIC
jgi:hypothetical protein